METKRLTDRLEEVGANFRTAYLFGRFTSQAETALGERFEDSLSTMCMERPSEALGVVVHMLHAPANVERTVDYFEGMDATFEKMPEETLPNHFTEAEQGWFATGYLEMKEGTVV